MKIFAIGKSQYSSFNTNWTNGNSIPVLVDPPPYTSWSSWGAGQRDLFFLDVNGYYHTDFNITTWDYDLIYDTIIDLLPETLLGDTNGDGILNVLDVVILVNIALSGAGDVSNADMNGDGVINVLDVVILIGIILS